MKQIDDPERKALHDALDSVGPHEYRLFVLLINEVHRLGSLLDATGNVYYVPLEGSNITVAQPVVNGEAFVGMAA